MSDREVRFSPEATDTVVQMHMACQRVGRHYGEHSKEYVEMSASLLDALAGIFRIGGQVSRDGPLSLYVASFIHYGVIFFPNDRLVDRATLLTAAVAGTWSVHS